MATNSVHTPVLLQESIDGLAIQPGDVVVDGTVGGAGHSAEILQRFGGSVELVCLDADEKALARAKETLTRFSEAKVSFIESNFRRIVAVLDELNLKQVNKMLLDLGLSSDELATSGRGFSFKNPDEPLLMSFSSASDALTAETIVNTWSEETLSTIFWGFGEERYAKKIAAAIVEFRRKETITTVGQLVDIVFTATPKHYHHRHLHPATRTFQALRIAANDELGALQQVLTDGWDRLAANGRIAVISFHSLEDRIVKRFFQEQVKAGRATLVSKKPLIPGAEEIAVNPRSRSAKLRIIIKK